VTSAGEERGSRLRVGLLSVAFSLFDAQMPAGFRTGLERTAERYREVLEQHFDVVFPGLVDSEESGRRARDAFDRAELSAIVFVPSGHRATWGTSGCTKGWASRLPSPIRTTV
jgi:hypothetical protein